MFIIHKTTVNYNFIKSGRYMGHIYVRYADERIKSSIYNVLRTQNLAIMQLNPVTVGCPVNGILYLYRIVKKDLNDVYLLQNTSCLFRSLIEHSNLFRLTIGMCLADSQVFLSL